MRSIVAAVVLAACGGSAAPPAAAPANQVVPTPGVIYIATQTITASPMDAQRLARQQAIEQARTAGILGSGSAGAALPDPPPGPLDEDTITLAVRTRQGLYRNCLAARLADDPTLHGTTTVLFAIGANGVVTEATGSGFDAKVDACVAARLEEVRFPAPPNGTARVSVSFRCQPES